MPKERARSRFLILDACVLIDYVAVDRSVLRTVSAGVAPIAVVRPVLEEVDALTEADASDLELSVVEVDLSLAAEATRASGRLSFQDMLCLLLAKRERWTCVTNDGVLRKACTKERVQTIWGLEMMAHAVEAGAMTAAEALHVAKQMHALNPRFITAALLAAFERRVVKRSS